MFRAVVWCAAILSVGAVAIFVPIDPAVLERLSLAETQDGPRGHALREAPPAYPGAGPGRHGYERDVQRRTVAAALSEPTGTPAPDGPEHPGAHAILPGRADGTGADRPAPSPAAVAAPATLPSTAAPSPFAAIRREPAPAAEVDIAATRALQGELRRLGCYHGEIDGDWGPASRYAAALFTKAVNAALPTDRPDTVLLALARQHSGTVCGEDRAAGVVTAAAPARLDRAPFAARSLPVTSPHSDATPGPSRAARVLPAPRIVSASGSLEANPAGADIIQIRPPMTQGDDQRMSLGAAPPAAEETPAAPVTRQQPRDFDTAQREQQARERRLERAQRERNSRRAKSRKWQREVFQAVDLGGS